MYPTQPSSFNHVCTQWSNQDWTVFLRLALPVWNGSLSSSNPQPEHFFRVIDLLKEQEREISLLPCGQEVLAKLPSDPTDPFFYFKRKAYLLAHNRVEFWKLLPGGAEYLSDKTDHFQLASELENWMRQRPAVLALKGLLIIKKNLTRLPPEIGLFTQLKSLMIAKTPLIALPSEFGKLTALKDLYISHAPMRQLCPEFQNLRSLEKLQISETELENIDVLENLEGLRHLNLTTNRIRKVPSAISWPRLELLFLDHNQIAELPDALYGQHSLVCLVLTSNQLTALSAKIASLVKLEILYLGHNQLSTLPDSMQELERLDSIYIEHNAFAEVPRCLRSIPSLKHIIH